MLQGMITARWLLWALSVLLFPADFAAAQGVDHNPPSVGIEAPRLGTRVPVNSSLTVTVKAKASDAGAIRSVVVVLDADGDGIARGANEKIQATAMGGDTFTATFGNLTGPSGMRVVQALAADDRVNIGTAVTAVFVGTGGTLLPAPPPGVSVPFEALMGLGAIAAVAVSPDGQKALLGGSNGYASLVNLTTGAFEQRLYGHTDAITAVAFTDSSDRVLTGSLDATVRLWDAATGTLLRMFDHHDGARSFPVTGLALSADGTRMLVGTVASVVAGETDYLAWLWDTATGTRLQRFAGHEAPMTAVAFFAPGPAGARVLTASLDKTVRVWNAGTGQLLDTWRGHSRGILALAVAPDGSQVLTGSADTTARLWDVATGVSQPLVGHSRAVTTVAFSPSGDRLLTGSEDGTAHLWDRASRQPLQPLQGHRQAMLAAVFVPPGGHRVLTGSRDGTARLWDSATGVSQPEMVGGHVDGISSLALSPSGSEVVSGSWDGTTHIWDRATGTVLRTFPGPAARVNAVAYFAGPAGTRVLTGSADGTARLWDRATGEPLAAFPGPVSSAPVLAVAFSPDGTHVLTGHGSGDPVAHLWDVATEKIVQNFAGPHIEGITAVAFASDGARILTGSEDASAVLWDAHSGNPIATFGEHGGTVTAVAFAPGDTRVVTACQDGAVRLWPAAANATPERVLTGMGDFPAAVTSVAFAPDGQRLVTGHQDHRARLWAVNTGELLRVFEGHRAAVTAVAFTPDGTRIATAGAYKCRFFRGR